MSTAQGEKLVLGPVRSMDTCTLHVSIIHLAHVHSRPLPVPTIAAGGAWGGRMASGAISAQISVTTWSDLDQCRQIYQEYAAVVDAVGGGIDGCDITRVFQAHLRSTYMYGVMYSIHKPGRRSDKVPFRKAHTCMPSRPGDP